MTSRSLTRIAFIGVVALLLIAASIAGVLVWEPAEKGNVKVVKKQGATAGTVFKPDARFVNPVSQSTSSPSIRPQSYTMSSLAGEGNRRGDDAITVLSEDGLQTDIDVTVRYRIDAGQTVEFYRNYRTLATTEERLIRPPIRSVLRTGTSRPPVTIICTGESQTQLKVAAERELAKEFADDGLIPGAIQVRNVELPAEYTQVVEQEEIAEQRHQQKQDKLIVEEFEVERKHIEAQGQADTNRILAESLSDEVLTQKHTGKLNEADTVYIPVGDDGHPQFVRSLGSDGSSSLGSSTGSPSDTTSALSRSSTSSDSEDETSN